MSKHVGDEHEAVRTTFGELKSGDYFRVPGNPVLCAKVHKKYIEVGKPGGRDLPSHTPVDHVGHARHAERKPVVV